MGQCLRGKMVEVGLIPASPAPVVADAETPGEQVVANIEEAVPAEPELDVTLPAATAVESEVDQVVAATFGLLRAEPDGSVVIAGSGTPGSRVEVFANGELLGTVEVEASGDWVFVPDAPLPPGGLEITLGEEGKTGTAEDSFIVVINEDKTSQPLVVASTPGEASEVLQGLTAPVQVAEAPAAEASTEPREPAGEPAAEPAASTSPEPSSSAVPVEPAEVTETEVSETPLEPAETPAATEPATVAQADLVEQEGAEESAMQVAALPRAPEAEVPETEVAETEVTETEVAGTEVEAAPAPTAAASANSTPVEPVPALESSTEPTAGEALKVPDESSQTESQAGVVAETNQTPDTLPSTADKAQEAAGAVVAEAPVTEPAQTQLATVPPTIDAIEIENDRSFFAGAGPDGGVIRLYVDDEFVADATIENGRWLIEAGPVLDQPSQRVRVDLLLPNSATVIARAEVDFVVDVPGGDEPVAVAQAEPVQEPVAPQPAPQTPPASATAQPSASGAAPATQETAGASSEPAVDSVAPAQSVDVTDAQTVEPVAPAATAEASVAPAETTAVETAAPIATEPVPANEESAAQSAEIAADGTSASDERAVPIMVAVSLGDPEAQRFASGKAIIRRGDNLWTIARRVYGEGLKYTTIYQANTGQIRDPDRIYPGQVFDLPEGLSGQ
ncbi:LysM peptidoglycan-binding domain-containing protein [Devosia sp. Naph2]|uniref:LysM peptidoglycan-binding domain-containing protein n=1 Tax=Devosia polycyclovorans TaxID=3345148 RepID=UPI0035D005F5